MSTVTHLASVVDSRAATAATKAALEEFEKVSAEETSKPNLNKQEPQDPQATDQPKSDEQVLAISADVALGAADVEDAKPIKGFITTHELSQEAGFEIKPDGKSNKYPLLKVYYEFGPWVGRNRKAICVRCKHTSASSQPERLIRHLRKCVALTDEDRQVAEELLLVSNANKKKKRSSQANEGDDIDYYDGDDNKTDISRILALPSGGPKRARRDHPDRKKHVDQCLVRFIICNKIPLKSVHSKEFVEFVRSLDPDYRLPSRDTITNTLIPGLLNI